MLLETNRLRYSRGYDDSVKKQLYFLSLIQRAVFSGKNFGVCMLRTILMHNVWGAR
jgi:hypothetical protein